jgi:hypothetical protein
VKAVELEVHLALDKETRLWYVASSDVPGLRLEAESVHELIRQVEDIAPELIDLNREEIAASHDRRLAGGYSPKCFPSDVTAAEVRAYRAGR